MLWLIFAFMTLVVLALLLMPLLRRPPVTAPRAAYDLLIYRDQLAEVEKDIGRGLLTVEQGEAARIEIYRRMLAAEDAGFEAAADNDPRSSFFAALGLVIILPAGAFLLYMYLGNPTLL